MSTMEYNGKNLIFVGYQNEGEHGWQPHSVIAGGDHYDFNFCKRDGCTYQHLSGSGPNNKEILLHPFIDPSEVRERVWCAPGIRMVISGVQLTPENAREFGYEILDSVEANPFDEACEGDTEYCCVCHDDLPNDRTCSHLQWNEHSGVYCGCGASETSITDTHISLYRLLALLDHKTLDVLCDEFRKKSPYIEWRPYYSELVISSRYPRTSIDLSSLQDELESEERYSEGLGWLHSLDEDSADWNALTLGWVVMFKRSRYAVSNVKFYHHWIPSDDVEKWLTADLKETPLIVTEEDLSQNRCANTIHFLRMPEMTEAVVLMPREDEKRVEYVTLSVAKTQETPEGIAVWFGRVLRSHGKYHYLRSGT